MLLVLEIQAFQWNKELTLHVRLNVTGKVNRCIIICLISNPAPSLPDSAVVESSEQPGRREFSVVFNKPDENNGPIRLVCLKSIKRFIFILHSYCIPPVTTRQW